RFRVALLDADGAEIAAGERDGDLRTRDVTIELKPRPGDGGQESDGGVDAAPDGGTPDRPIDTLPCIAQSCGGTVANGCCPPGCGPATDTDCNGCGNGRLDPGETCDPPGSCPVCDDQNDCTTDTVSGSANSCNLVCSHAAKTCSTAGKDKCCPIGCTAAEDSDCAACGDGVVDPAAGETCDPADTCPSAQSCTSTM